MVLELFKKIMSLVFVWNLCKNESSYGSLTFLKNYAWEKSCSQVITKKRFQYSLINNISLID